MYAAVLAGLSEAVAGGRPWLLPLAFAGGLCTSLNPCAYPMMAAVVGYVWACGQGRRWRGLAAATALVLGLGLTYALMGALGGFVGPRLGLSPRTWSFVVGGVCILAGLVMAQVVPLELAAPAPLRRVWHRLHGLPGALALGALLGLVATPCATPPLAIVMSLAAAHQHAVLGATLLFAYALGHAAPAVAIGLLAGSLHAFERLAPCGRVLQIAGGWVIIGLGLSLVASA